jgi:integrase
MGVQPGTGPNKHPAERNIVPIHKLTQTRVDRLVAAKRRGKHGDGGGLILQVGPRGASWLFRYGHAGKDRAMGLGSTATRTLEEAREAARQARIAILEGKDPLAAKAAGRMTFEACFKAFWQGHRLIIGNLKQRTNYENSVIRYAIPVIGAVPVDQISQVHVLRVIEPLWLTKTQSMRKLRGRIEQVLSFAKGKGYRTGDNPATWEVLQHVLPSPKDIAPVKHHAAIDHKDMVAFMVKLRAAEGPALLDRRALELVILTAVRTGDIIGQRSEERPPLKWTDIDLDRGAWQIPACKVDVPHTVALSDRAVAILSEVRALGLSGDAVFPIGKDAMLEALQAIRPGMTVHGMRSSFRTWVHQRTSFPRELAEECLSHRLIGDAVELSYLRDEALAKRRVLMQAWSAHCAGTAADNVVPLPAHAA